MKANTLLRLFALTVLIALFSACATPAYIPPAPPPTPVAQISPTAAPTAVTASTNTSVPPTATINATAVATATINVTAVATSTATASPTATATGTASPTATATSMPTNTRTATHVPPTRKPTVAATRKPTAVPGSFTVTWKTGFEYNPRDATSSWCQMHNQYQNLTGEVMPFQGFADQSKMLATLLQLKPEGIQGGYQPIVGIANPDGTINRWQLAGWYARAFGWSNGIQKFPPDGLAANSTSDDWTWYGVAHQGEYCRYAYVRWKGQVSVAEYGGDGKLVNAKAALPSGAP